MSYNCPSQTARVMGIQPKQKRETAPTVTDKFTDWQNGKIAQATPRTKQETAGTSHDPSKGNT